MEVVGAKTRKAAGVFGDTARDFYKSQLLLSEGFQNLFDKGSQGTMDKFEIDFDWDRIITESMTKGGDVGAVVRKQINDALAKDGTSMGELRIGNKRMYADLRDLEAEVNGVFGAMGEDTQGFINSQEALAGSTQHTVNQMVDDYELLDDVTKKTVDNMAAGFKNFASSGELIGLTQKFNEIFAQEDVDVDTKAAQWEEAWADAYGGASFNIAQYMDVFRRASGEQSTFIANLQSLSARGLSTSIISELSAMGPEANRLVQALVDGTAEQLVEYEDLWGQTGYDSMIQLATQTAIGQEIVKNVMATGGLEALKAFNAQLASGVGVDEALASLQLDVNGKPITPALKEPDTYAFRDSIQRKLNGGISLPVTPYLTRSTIVVEGSATIGGSSSRMYAVAQGGYISGPGSGTSDDIPAWLSNGEFVMTAKATRAIGASNLYQMMRAAQGGRAAPRGRGFATGGMVGGGSSSGYGGTTVVELSVRDRALLAQLGNVQLLLDGKAVAEATNSANFVSTKRGAS
jgi:hypothetical protein